MPALNKTSNLYAEQLGAAYDQIPKAVFAAIAVSAMTQGGDYLEHALRNVVTEWDVLHANKIVPQAVPAKLRHLISGSS